jgi:hypothetical protein
MDPQQCPTMANKFQSVLDEEVRNARGKPLGFAPRERLITPFRLRLSVIASMATQHVHTIADLGYPLKAGQLAYPCHRSKTSGMLAAVGRSFRGMKLLRYIGVPP